MAGFHVVAGHGSKENRVSNDDYPTPPPVTQCLLLNEKFPDPVWCPADGAGHLSRVVEGFGSYRVHRSCVTRGVDFLKTTKMRRGTRSIVENPPYVLAEQFIQHAIDLGAEKHAWLLRLQFAEAQGRFDRLFSRNPPARVYVFPTRVQVSERGLVNPRGGLICFAWWVWDHTTEVKRKSGITELRWFSREDLERTGILE